VAFRFEKASCVVVGTFNMYILNPQWLAGNKIIDDSSDVGFETNLTRPGFRFRIKQAVWSVAPDRLTIETQDPEVDCGKVIADILQKLPHTPLVAIGSNTQYEANLSELEKLSQAIRDFPRAESPSSGYKVAQRTFHVGVKRAEEETVNLQIAVKEASIALACNVHVDVGRCELPSNAAIDAARRFFDDRVDSERLAQHFFGTAIDHAPNSD
jgi:hypothetical protein